MMEEKRHHMDDIFRNKLKDFRREPPEDLWMSIRENMAAEKKKRILLLFMRAAAGVALILATGLGYHYLGHHGPTHTTVPLASQKEQMRQSASTPSTSDRQTKAAGQDYLQGPAPGQKKGQQAEPSRISKSQQPAGHLKNAGSTPHLSHAAGTPGTGIASPEQPGEKPLYQVNDLPRDAFRHPSSHL